MQLGSVLRRERHVGEHVVLAVVHQLAELRPAGGRSWSATWRQVCRALAWSGCRRAWRKRAALQRDAAARLDALTPRQRIVMERVLAGQPSKNIAADLGISQRTVESHRAEVMHRVGVRSLPALARLVLVAGAAASETPP